ncbi:MAG: aspartyl protease family protein [Phycisphaerae bacterium]
MNRRTWTLIGSAVILPAISIAQVQIHPAHAPERATLPAAGVTLLMLRHHRLPLVEAKINGQGPLLLVVDSGAPGLTLSRRVADSLQLGTPPGLPAGVAVEVRMAGAPGGEGIPAKLGWVDLLELGEARFEKMPAIAADIPFAEDVDGIVGFNVFEDCLITLDYPNAKIRLAQDELKPGDDVLDFTVRGQAGSHPRIKLSLCGQPQEFTIDTGMSGWTRMSQRVLERCGLTAESVSGPKARMIDGAIETRVGRLKGDLGVAKHEIKSPIVMIQDGECLIGSQLMQNFAVSFDQKNRRVKFERSSSAAIAVPELRGIGASFERAGAYLRVWDVQSGAKAEAAGMKVGDVVKQIDGKPAIDTYSSEQWDELLKRPKLRLTLAGENGADRQLDVEPAVLVK